MSQAESLEIPEGGRTFSYAEVARNVTIVGVGDTVEIPEFRKQFDPFVISLINATVSADVAGTRMRQWMEYHQNPGGHQFLGTVAVQGVRGLTFGGKERFDGWPSDKALPSEAIKPPRHQGDIRNASVLVLGASIEQTPDGPPLRGIDLLLRGDIHSTGRGIRAHAAARLIVQRLGSFNPRIRPQRLTGRDAEQAVDEMLEESKRISREQASFQRRKAQLSKRDLLRS
jgi:hypothetical protein